MLTYRSDELDRFYFKNLDKIDEQELFKQAKRILENTPEIEVGTFREVAYVDIWTGKFNGIEFKLWLDINYGPFLICKNEIALREIENIINVA